MSTMYNQSANGYSGGGGGGGSENPQHNEQSEPTEEDEFGRTEEEFYEDMQRELADDAPWKRIQQNTFTRWANEHLKLLTRHIDDLQVELGDGLNLIALIEVLSQKKVPRYNKRPNFRSQKLENVSVVLDFLENTERIRLVNIDASHIVDGKLKLILGLIWTLILHYSISLPMWEFDQPDGPGSGKDVTPKQKLMNWIQEKFPPELPISNFTSDWNDGRAIGALVDACAPGLYPDWNDRDPKNALENAKEAMDLAERWLGIPQLIEPHEMINPKVDEQSMMTYLSQYPNAKLKPGAPIRPKTNSARVRCYGKGIEPTGNHVDAPAKFHVETFAAGKGTVDVLVLNPKGQKEKCDVIPRNDKNQTYDCTYYPTMEGQYRVIVKFAGQEVPKSPFSPFIEGKSGDASQCRATGPGLEPNGVMVDKPTWFEIDATNAGNGIAEVVLVDAHGRENVIPVSVKQTGPGKSRCEYVPREPGLHSVNVFFAGRPIPHSPYGVNVSPSSDAKKCRAFGRGIQPKGVRTGDVAEFRVVTKDAGEGVMKATITGPDGSEIPCRVTKTDSTTYECGYVPNRPGPYSVNITYGGAHIPKSPFPVSVAPFKDTRIRAFGPGLESGIVGFPADFVVETNGETGSLGFSIEGPSQARIECNDNGDGSANVRYWPTIPGEYAVHILCNEEDIPHSPYMAWIEPPGNFDANKVKAYGPGIEPSGQIINKPTEFTVDTHNAGDAPLHVQAIDQEYQPVDVHVRNNGNGTYTCRYTPTNPNRHCILIDYGGVAIPKSPFRVWPTEPSNPSKVRVYGPGVERGVKMNNPTHFTVDCKEAGPGDISIALIDTKNQDLPFTIDDKQDGTFEITYTPKSPGVHCISVLFAENEIPISPLKVNVEPTVDVNKIRIEGLETRVFLESPTEFTVDAKSLTGSGTGRVECLLTSPSGRAVRCPVKNMTNGTYQVQYAPYEPGMHQLDVTYENIPVPNSPFRVNAVPGCDSTRVRAYGPGLENATTNEPTTFTIETKGAGQGSLGLAIEGPSEAKMVCKDNQDGTCVMEYLPTKAGQYDIAIKFAEQHVPGSPFHVNVRDQLDANRVNVKMSSTMRTNTLQEIVIDGQAAGPGNPAIDITDSHGRRKPASIRPRGDGVYVAEFTPQTEGPHRIDINWSDKPVRQSPFNVQVLPNFEPQKVIVDGPGIRNGIPASLETSFRIDTREAGLEQPEVSIKNPEGVLVTSKLIDNKDGTYKVIYKPNDIGRYIINVNYGGIPVHNSPFNVKVEPTGDPTKCHITGSGINPNVQIGEEYTITVDTHEAGPGAVTCRIRSTAGNDLDIDIVDNEDGTFNLFYTPHNPGNYVIKIKFGGQDIPGGDFVITAGDVNKYNRTQTTETVTTTTTTTSQYRPVDFRLPVGGGQLGEITALIRTPNGKFHTPLIDDNQDGTVSIKYQPSEIGLHELDVFYQGQPIAGSPFKFHVDKVQTGYVTAYGPGLSHGVCNEPCNFRIVTKDAGSGGLSVAVEGSSKAEIQCKDNKDGTCDVTYWPTAPGEYTITVKFADKHIVGSPFTAKVTGIPPSVEKQRRSQVMVGSQSEISLRVTEYDIHDLTATIRSPSGIEEPCLLKKLPNGSLGISFIPREVGDHLVNVYREGKHIKNSPFRINVGSSEIGDASKVKVFGRGLQEGYANQTNEFTVVTRDAGYGGLSLSIEGPSKADIECHDNEDGSCLVTYKPTEPGVYIVNVKFADKHVPGSPFTVNVGGHGSNRLRESITRERRAADITHIGSQCELSLKIPGTSSFDMSAYVTSPSGRLENCEIVDVGDYNYSIKFIPKEMGIHTVSVKHKDVHIPGSPFEFTVGPLQGGGAHKVRASGNGLQRGEVNTTNEFNIYTREAGAGGLAIAVEGPAKAEIDFFDRKDGSCGVSYACPEAGEYQISIKFNDTHIPDSPFNVSIAPPFGDAKKLTIHSLKTKGLEVNHQYTFTINVNGARGRVDARVTAPSGAEESCVVQEMGNDHYAIQFIPKENGIHWIHVRFNGRDIPDSPFRVVVGQANADPGRVFASGTGLYQGETGEPCEFLIDTTNAGAGALAVTVDGPSKVQLDCREVAEGYRVTFTPTAPGDYLISIKFAGTNIAGSPFKCIVGGGGVSTVRSIGNVGTGAGGLSTMTTSSSSYVQRSQGNVSSHTRYDAIEKTTSYSSSARNNSYAAVDASRVRAQGEGLSRAYQNEKATFSVDTRDGGNAMLMVGVFGPKAPCEEVFIKHIGNNQYNVQYTVREKGEYMLIVKWGDQHIPGSPWHIEVV